MPICQDTGTVWVSLEIGPDVAVRGDVFADVDDAVARAYDEARLRTSVVRDAVSTARTRATTRRRSATSIPWTSRARRGCTLC